MNFFSRLLLSLFSLAACLALLACAGAGKSTTARPLNAVPVGSLTMLEGSLNEVNTKFIVDTGAPTTLLALQEAERYGVEVGRKVGKSGGLGGITSRFVGVIDYWKFAGREGGPTYIMLQNMPFADEAGGPDGLAGLDLLQGLQVIIDYSKRLGYGELLVDSDGSGSRSLRRKAQAQGWRAVPLSRVEGESYHMMPVVLAGQTRNWIVDTGAQRGLITRQFADELGIPYRRTRNRIIGATGLMEGSLQADKQRVGLPNGDGVLTNLIVLEPQTLGLQPPKSIRYGLIGVDVLNAAGAIYDIGNAILYLPPVPRG